MTVCGNQSVAGGKRTGRCSETDCHDRQVAFSSSDIIGQA